MPSWRPASGTEMHSRGSVFFGLVVAAIATVLLLVNVGRHTLVGCAGLLPNASILVKHVAAHTLIV